MKKTIQEAIAIIRNFNQKGLNLSYLPKYLNTQLDNRYYIMSITKTDSVINIIYADLDEIITHTISLVQKAVKVVKKALKRLKDVVIVTYSRFIKFVPQKRYNTVKLSDVVRFR